MVRKSRTILFLSGILICTLFAACSIKNPDVPTPVLDLEATKMENLARTQAAETLSAAISKSTQDAILTANAPTATRTIPATRTPTATITNTPFIGSAVPTDLTLTPQITAPVLKSSTAFTAQWECKIVKTTPRYKTEIQKGKNFEAHWQLLNSGYSSWYNNTVTASYRNGTDMHTNDGEMAITDAVDPGDIYEVIVPMKAPLEKGTYSTVWVLSNKKEDFCWFTVDIEVK